MSIHICKENCIGCRQCITICPGSLLELDEDGKANMLYPKDCWGCASCVKECKMGAIELQLGVEIGGEGGLLSVDMKEDITTWTLKKVDGSHTTIVVNRQEANTY